MEYFASYTVAVIKSFTYMKNNLNMHEQKEYSQDAKCQ